MDNDFLGYFKADITVTFHSNVTDKHIDTVVLNFFRYI